MSRSVRRSLNGDMAIFRPTRECLAHHPAGSCYSPLFAICRRSESEEEERVYESGGEDYSAAPASFVHNPNPVLCLQLPWCPGGRLSWEIALSVQRDAILNMHFRLEEAARNKSLNFFNWRQLPKIDGAGPSHTLTWCVTRYYTGWQESCLTSLTTMTTTAVLWWGLKMSR